MRKPTHTLLLIAACLGIMQLTGCVQFSMSQPKPSIENAQKSRNIQNAAASVGSFVLAADQPQSMDKKVSIRTNKLSSPVNGSFAQYLQETLRVELQASGLLSPDAANVISGELSDSQVNAPVGTGTAALAARFIVTRNGEVRYDKTLQVDASWKSLFIGMEAIPVAAGQYELLYRKLVGVLLDDPDFRQVLSKT